MRGWQLGEEELVLCWEGMKELLRKEIADQMVVKKETKIKNENENKYVISIYQKSHNNMLHNVKNKHQFEYGEKKKFTLQEFWKKPYKN